ncbi:hypothetical protein NQ315_009495 [Exocentrus adspersus]|uniref:Transcriptional regulator ATRX n=1 Tax=Exocentrus adspersus TaxID=1586481 RepID=A0AAV8WHM9_9CUCU|nr:hypothetical protein NQ315_009495 [Exocentrus adspersus]
MGINRRNTKSKKIKKSVKKTKGTSGTDSSSDYSHSDSDNPPHDNANTLPSYAQLDQKLDDFLANEICKVLKSNSSNESTDIDSDESDVKEKNDRDGKSICNNVEKKKQILSTEERLKKAWKNDPLLRGKLSSNDSSSTSSSASASDSEKSHKKRQALRTKYEHETDLNVISDDSDSDDDALNRAKLNKAQLEAKLISPIKRNIPKLDDSSDSDSDVEIIVLKSATPEKVANGDDHEFPGSSQKGRRNIRALMSDESLAEATQRANKEEQERIERLEGRHRVKESLSQSFTQSFEEDTMVLDMDDLTGEPLITVHPKLIRRLKPHQKSGIQFMWDSCYESVERLKVDDGSGCILAHCMGLGKTLQVITLLHTLFAYNQTNTKHVLVVCPLSTVNNWKKEVKLAFKRFPEGKLNVLTIADKKEVSQKYDLVKKWRMQKKSVLVLGYEGFETLTNENKLDKIGEHLKKRILEALIDPGPDLVVCDEGHLLRNKKALKTLALNRIKTKRRIVLTGTPLQNNLLEYYYMVDFVKPNLLGNMKEYKTNFVNPITNGQYEDSTAEDIKLMMKRTHVLHKLLKKTIQRVEDTELKAYLPKIVDHAVFIQLHQVQVNLYNKFSELVMKNSRNTNKGGFLSDFSVFQYICTHPHLLAVMENLRNKRIKERDLITNEQEDNLICNIEGWWKAVTPADAAEKIEYGNKLMVLKSIIEQCEEIGDKVLVFSQSLGEMDLIEHFLIKVGTAKCRSWQKKIDYARMDGTVPPVLRSTICDLFNDKDNSKLRLLLMSTKVGGLGLNLTAANRVIIMTVNWNPSYDIQSVFRVYRFGQEKRVYVYRLVALDSMEEKVYQRTVTKLAIAHRVVDKHQITRHYKSMDLQELYSCRPNADIERPISNVPEDKVLAKLILKLPYIYKYHEHQALLENRPEDNLNEHELNAAWDEFKRIKDAPPPVPPMPHAQQTVAHIPNNGPSFAMAYNLSRSKVAVVNDKKNGEVGKLADEILQYFTPAANNLAMNDLKKNPYSVASSLKPVRKGAVIDKQTIPAPATTNSAVERDPLFIPLSADTNNKTNKSYGELLTTFSQKHPSAIPKLPSGTTIMLEAPRSKPSQKENQQHKKPGIFKRPTNESIVILDDDSSKTKNHRSLSQPNPPVGIKRKRNIEGERQAILKRMREGFNKITNQLAPINIDDDDDISEVTDTVSETGSLSNELITNLGRSGITIHKVLRDAKSNNEVITLD